MLTHERLLAVLAYDPVTGAFTWRPRRREEFKSSRAMNVWNAVFAGKPAGSKPGRYLKIMIDHVSFQAHRLAWFYMTGEWPSALVDHRNRDTDDNRWTNLREATGTQNQANRWLQKSNKTGAKGVCWRETRQCWTAQIHVAGRQIYLGKFSEKSAAIAAYDSAARIHYGEFAAEAKP